MVVRNELTNLEEVEERHGTLGEAVHKECFQVTLDVVESPAQGSNAGREGIEQKRKDDKVLEYVLGNLETVCHWHQRSILTKVLQPRSNYQKKISARATQIQSTSLTSRFKS